jgi:hypothetical protein
MVVDQIVISKQQHTFYGRHDFQNHEGKPVPMMGVVHLLLHETEAQINPLKAKLICCI